MTNGLSDSFQIRRGHIIPPSNAFITVFLSQPLSSPSSSLYPVFPHYNSVNGLIDSPKIRRGHIVPPSNAFFPSIQCFYHRLSLPVLPSTHSSLTKTVWMGLVIHPNTKRTHRFPHPVLLSTQSSLTKSWRMDLVIHPNTRMTHRPSIQCFSPSPFLYPMLLSTQSLSSPNPSHLPVLFAQFFSPPTSSRQKWDTLSYYLNEICPIYDEAHTEYHPERSC